MTTNTPTIFVPTTVQPTTECQLEEPAPRMGQREIIGHYCCHQTVGHQDAINLQTVFRKAACDMFASEGLPCPRACNPTCYQCGDPTAAPTTAPTVELTVHQVDRCTGWCVRRQRRWRHQRQPERDNALDAVETAAALLQLIEQALMQAERQLTQAQEQLQRTIPKQSQPNWFVSWFVSCKRCSMLARTAY